MRDGSRLSLAARHCCSARARATTPRDPRRGGVGEPDPDTDGDGSGGDPDAGGEEPTALERAYEAANAAVRAATAAADAAAAANTQVARDRALELIGDARSKLDEVVGAARNALDAAEGSAERGAATRARDAAVEYRATQAQVLDNAHGRTGWSGRSAVAAEIPYPSSTVDAVRNPRRNADGSDATTLLKAEDIPPVMYEDGKTVITVGRGSSGDRLRMRGIPVARTHSSGNRRLLIYDLNGTAYGSTALYVDPIGGGNDGPEPEIVAGLTITSTGLVVAIGGKGATGIDYTLASRLNVGYMNEDGSDGGYDLELTFGRPAASPEGNAEHYWAAALMPTSQQLAFTYNPAWNISFTDGERTIPLGVYHLRLSTHIGLDRNLEDPAAEPDANARDDVNSYLSYAAYGAMDFVVTDFENSATIRNQSRIFPFHAGYDAFRDEAGMRTTDIAAADRITNGTFKGRTMAVQTASAVFNIGGLDRRYDALRYSGPNFRRLRGDVELTATISGAASNNKISGKIKNLEQWDTQGYWENYAKITGELALQEGDIGASGSFAGVIDTGSLADFAEGGYRGNFYGPHDDLEAAGIWYLQDGYGGPTPSDFDNEDKNLQILGSFGAALVRDDGTYGVQVGADTGE